jgi:hypothetical protein
MGAAQEQEYSLARGGVATGSAISRALAALQRIQDRDDGQKLLETLQKAATPENYETPLKLEPGQIRYLDDLNLTDKHGRIVSQSTAMIIASSIHFTEGQYMVFAPIA